MKDSQNSVLNYVSTWAIMLPLFYLASTGILWFQSAAKNNQLSATYGALVNSATTGQNFLIAGIAYGIVLFYAFKNVKQIQRAFSKVKVAFIMPCYALLSVAWSQFPRATFLYALCLLISTVFAGYFYQKYKPNDQLKVVMALGWVCLLFSIILVILFPMYGLDNSGVGGWKGMYVQKNVCAAMTVFMLSAGFYVRTNTGIQKILKVLYIIMSTFLVIMTGSRGGWSLLFVSILFYFFSRLILKFKSVNRLIIIVAIGLIFAIIATLIASYYEYLSYLIGKDPSFTGRTVIWAAVIVSALKHPFLGYGYMGFWRGADGEASNVVSTAGWVVTGSHNGFLDIWLTLGFVGLSMVFYSIYLAFKKSIYVLANYNEDSYEYNYLIWCISIPILMIFHNMDETQVMGVNDLSWFLYILSCVGLCNMRSSVARKNG